MAGDLSNVEEGAPVFTGDSDESNDEVAVDSASPAEQIPGPVLQAQTVLIKAAKQEVTAPTLETLAQLRAANDAFNAACRQEHSTP